jgi:hypothetical protein
MIPRILYAAVALLVLGAFPRGGTDRAPGGAARRSAEVVAPALTAPGRADRWCARGADQGGGRGVDIGRAADFAIPRIER